MKKLIELVEVVTRNKVKSIKIIGRQGDRNTKLMQFYKGILSGKLTNDEEAFGYLYPKTKDRNAFYKLKHDLSERLRNTLFFIDTKQNKFSDIKRAYLECQKLIINFNLLLIKGARENALHIGEKAVRIAEDYEFTHEIIFLSKSLAANYASISGNRKKYQEYADKVFNYQELFQAETMVELYYSDLVSLYVKDKSTKTHVYHMANQYLLQLEKYRGSISSSNFIFGEAMLRTIKYMSVNNYEMCYQITFETLQHILRYHFLNTRAFCMLSFQHIACCIQLKKHEEGISAIQELLEMMEPGTFNWFKTQELRFTLSLHTRRYNEAFRIYQISTGHPGFKKLVSNIKETWVIYSAWVHLLKMAHKIKQNTLQKTPKFRIQKFMNEVPTFSQDKRGLNVPILISQIFLLLQQKKYDVILDRFEAIGKYKDRYLDREHNFRSNVFIRMLLEVPKAHFRRNRVIKSTKTLCACLEEVSLETANQSHDLEILPYEDAWGLLLDLLD